jgi:predicted DNA-binding transcriptional regulator AlpA
MRSTVIAQSSSEIIEKVRRAIGDAEADYLQVLLDAPPSGHCDPILSREQVAKILGCSLLTLHRMHERGEGPPRAQLTPRRWGYSSRALSEWQRERLEEGRRS